MAVGMSIHAGCDVPETQNSPGEDRWQRVDLAAFFGLLFTANTVQ
jgi:hypothetical protein